MEHERVEIRARAELHQWLIDNRGYADNIWLVTWKKHTAFHVSSDDVVEEALCFGWIDSQLRKLDADRSMIRLSPRKPGSTWSGVNKARVESLVARGLMAPAGLARIEGTRPDGSWIALDGAGALAIPEDLEKALRDHPGGYARFTAFPPSAQRSILEWSSLARRPATRTTRVKETARLAELGQRANQWSKRQVDNG